VLKTIALTGLRAALAVSPVAISSAAVRASDRPADVACPLLRRSARPRTAAAAMR
jgi:hypothetical protein